MDHNIGERFDVYPGIHAEVVAATSYSVGAGGLCTANKCTTNDTFSNNIIKNCRASGCIQTILSGGDPIPIDSWRIFGNVFVDDQSGDGTITPGGPSGISNTLVYNNTGVNIHRFFEECANFTSCALSNGNVVKNNLLYKSDSRINAKSDVGTGTGGPIDHDYNTFWNPIDAGLSEPNGQIVIGSPCPLQNCAIDNTGNYHLLQGGGTGTNQVNAGLALSSTYSLDPDGNIRGADGVWDRGAYEFADAFPGANPPPARPKGVRLP
ncbi:MAG: hypothetical protein A3J74_11265 [Elusimicrobia bacterium RIFCSPHIGHO2_02_FULL_57_9]|nr:MAG: hypothetical protein A3J74_11265 [Elusimicrobia bacterium RIFCSPHIGHO2_02_FULL_57_9]